MGTYDESGVFHMDYTEGINYTSEIAQLRHEKQLLEVQVKRLQGELAKAQKSISWDTDGEYQILLAQYHKAKKKNKKLMKLLLNIDFKNAMCPVCGGTSGVHAPDCELYNNLFPPVAK